MNPTEKACEKIYFSWSNSGALLPSTGKNDIFYLKNGNFQMMGKILH